MAKTIPFNIKLSVDGKEVIVDCKKGVQDLGRALGTLPSQAEKMSRAFQTLGSVSALMRNMSTSLQSITGVMHEMTTAYQVQEEAELKLQTVMRQRMNATDDMVDSVKKLASAQQEIGVIGDEVQLAGAQQVATFLKEKQSIETLLPAMNNLAVQRKGLNVTSEDMVSIGNLVGKVMQGQVSALTRVGITFDAAQQKVLKYGTESEKAATLAQVITDNVGNMNAELAKTDAGKAKQMANSFGDMQEQIGKAFAKYEPLMQGFSQLGIVAMSVGQLGAAVIGATKALFAFTNTSAIAGVNSRIAASAINSLSKSTGLFAATSTAATVATKALTWAIRALEVATVVGGVIAAISVGVEALGVASSGTSESLEDLTQAQKDASASADKVKEAYESKLESTLSELQEQYARLKTQWASLRTEAAKTQWIENNKKAFSDLGASVSSVSDAEAFFKDQTGAVVASFRKRAQAAAYAAKLTALYKKQLDLIDKQRSNAKAIAADASSQGRSAKAGDVIADESYRSERYGSVDRSGTWRFSERGAALYSGASAKGNSADTAIERSLAQVRAEIEETTKDMAAAQKEISTPVSFDISKGKGGSSAKSTSKAEAKVFNDAAVTTKQISDNISILQTKLSNTDPKSEKYKEVSNEITKWQAKLDDINRGYETGSLADYEARVGKVDEALKKLNLSEAERNALLKKRDELQAKADDLNNAGIEKGSIDDLNNQLSRLQKQFNATGSIYARVIIKAKIDDLQRQIDEQTNGKLTIPSEPEADAATRDKEGSYQNAESRSQTIQRRFEIGIIGKDEAQKQIDDLNEQLKSLGLKPINIEIKTDTDEAMEKLETLKNELQSNFGGSVGQAAEQFAQLGQYLKAGGDAGTAAAAGMALVGQQMQEIGGDGAVAKIGATMAAIGQVILGFATASAQASSLGPWGWIAFLGAGLAAVATTISTIQSYATGGIVPGSSYSGDKVTAHVNSGEMILNMQQQRRLFAIANGNVAPKLALPTLSPTAASLNTQQVSGGGMVSLQGVDFRIRGRELVGVMRNETQIAAKSGRRTGIKV